MDVLGDDQTLQAVLGREEDFDNDGLDFSQLANFIDDDNGSTGMWSDLAQEVSRQHVAAAVVSSTAAAASSLPPSSAVIGSTLDSGDERMQYAAMPTTDATAIYVMPHNLPESPPDSGSEPPYSPQEHAGLSPSQKGGGVGPVGPVGPTMMLLPPGPAMYAAPPSQQSAPQLPDNALVQVLLPPPADASMVCCDPTAAHLQQSNPPPAGPPPPPPPPPPQSQPPQQPMLITPSAAVSKKRKLSQDGVHVKLEPAPQGVAGTDQVNEPSSSPNTTLDDDMCGDAGEGGDGYSDPSFQCIRFSVFQQSDWHVLCDQGLNQLAPPKYQVVADKGFNYSNADEAFVCQKKNHFQITCHVLLVGAPQFVKTGEGLKKVVAWRLHFYGVKTEAPAQTIKVEQSQSDRSKRAFHPVQLELQRDEPLKATVGRLHFSETTSNNMRKKGKPNPDQRYFLLVVALHAHCADGQHYPVVMHASERIIVRASNPGQFESDAELCWQKGAAADAVWHAGRVGVNTDRPDEALVVHGNARVTGHLLQPSDARAKTVVAECDTRQSLLNVSRLRLLRYRYAPDFARHAGLPVEDAVVVDTGILAQDVQRVLPEAVRDAGDLLLPGGRRIDNFLVVNKDRIFMENVGAVKELCKVTGNLETRVDELEKISRRLAKLRRADSGKSSASFTSVAANGLPIPGTRKDVPTPAGPSISYGFTACSNSLVQATTIALVLIMALCLAAMATLYFMEYQKKTNSESSTLLPQQITRKQEGPSTTTIPPIFELSTKKSTKTKVRPAPRVTTARSPTEEIIASTSHDLIQLNHPSVASVASSEMAVQRMHRPAAYQHPPLPSRTISASQNHGDPRSNTMTLSRRPAFDGLREKCLPDQGRSNVLTCKIYCSKVPTVNSFIGVANQTSRPPVSSTSVASVSTTQASSGILMPKSSDQPPTELPENTLTQGKQPQSSQSRGLDVSSEERRNLKVFVRFGDPEKLLGPELCAKSPLQTPLEEQSCRNWTASNYTYLMPLRRDQPDYELDLVFNFPERWPLPTAMRCPRDNLPKYSKPCEGVSLQPSARRIPTRSSKDYSITSVTFRVRIGGASKDLCQLDSSQLGVLFLEYNVHFQRT